MQKLHPILGLEKFPNCEVPLSTAEKFLSQKRQKTVSSLCRKVIKAVQSGRRGRGENVHWEESVKVDALKTNTARSLIGESDEFSLADFIPWKKMQMKDFNSGPPKKDFIIPVKSWDCFQVLKAFVL